jgi:hypothetical protein
MPWEIAWDDAEKLRKQISHCVCQATIDIVNVENPRRYLVPGTEVSALPAQAQSLSSMQIKQIEEIAQNIAAQHNTNAKAMVDDMTVSSTATVVGRNIRLEFVLRVKKGLPPAKLKEFSDEIQREIVPKSCAVNAKNPAFDRGLTYTFSYKNTYGEKLAEFTVDQAVCKTYR